MRKATFVSIVALFLSIFGASITHADPGPDTPTSPALTATSTPTPAAARSEHFGTKQQVRVGVYVNALREVDALAQTFRADLFWWMRYRRRAPGLVDDVLEEIRFVNGDVESQELEERKAIGDDNYVLYRVRAQFHFHANFRRYPFDLQSLPIAFEHGYLHADSLELVPDVASYARSAADKTRYGLGDHVRLSDMVVTDTKHTNELHTYHTDFGDTEDPVGSTTMSRASMTIEAQREVWPFLFKIVIPLLIIQTLAYLVFFVHADRIDVAVGLTVTSLLASIAFQISLSDSLPDIGYLTTADRIFHLSYLLIMLAMGQMVYAYNLHAEGLLERAQKLDALGRVLYPLTFFGGVALICAYF